MNIVMAAWEELWDGGIVSQLSADLGVPAFGSGKVLLVDGCDSEDCWPWVPDGGES